MPMKTPTEVMSCLSSDSSKVYLLKVYCVQFQCLHLFVCRYIVNWHVTSLSVYSMCKFTLMGLKEYLKMQDPVNSHPRLLNVNVAK